MVSYMDGAVGDIVALLRRKDEMFAKTLIVFQSDNGAHLPLFTLYAALAR